MPGRRSQIGAAAALLLGLLPLLAHAAPVQEFLDRLVKRERLPGAVLLVSGPQGREVAVAGVANLKTGEKVTPQTRFYIASSGKLATAAATLQLVEEKKIRLNDPVFPWVKGVPGITKLRNVRDVTIEQLLNHRSGLAEYFTDEFESEATDNPDKIFSAAESLAFAYGQKAQARPGRAYSYTNTNYVLLGRMIEEADSASYAASLKRRIFDPVGMAATSVGAKAGPGLARGYATGERNKREDVSFSGWNAVTGDGALVTTAGDYEAFLLALFRDGKLLPRKTVERMCTTQEEDPDSGYGLGCSIDETPWGDAWGHNGSVSGFNADTWFIPKIGVTIVFFTNGDYRSDDAEILIPAVKAFLKQ